MKQKTKDTFDKAFGIISEFFKTANIGVTIEPKKGAKFKVEKNDLKYELNYDKNSDGKSTINANFGGKSK